MFQRIWISIFLFVALAVGASPAVAQDAISRWLRYDVNVTVQQNSGLSIEEIHEVALTSGATTFTRIIPTDQLESISNFQVSEVNPSIGQRGYQQADTQANYTFQLYPSGEDNLIMVLHFPQNTVASTRFVIRYFVVGGVRIYDDGDRLSWRPFGHEAAAPIESSNTTFSLPAQFSTDQLSQSSVGVTTEQFVSDGDRAIYRATNVPAGDSLQVSLTFPHGVVAGTPPAWQQEADTLEYWQPILQWGSVILSLLLLLIGPLAAFGWWYSQRRISSDIAGKVPKYLTKPPGKLTPALAGVLLDGKSTPRHLKATLLDLAAKGALNVYESSNDEAENDPDPGFDLYAVNRDKAVLAYEVNLYTKIFGLNSGARKRSLAQVREPIYLAVSEMKTQIEADVAKAGFFSKDAGVVRRQYAAFGAAAIVICLFVGGLTALILSKFTLLVACPFLAIALGVVAFIITGFSSPERSEKGQKLSPRWQAFKRYLAEIDKNEAAKSGQRFSRLLPYAVAFGVEQRFIKQFTAVETPGPHWWSIPEEKLPEKESAYSWMSQSQGATLAKERPAGQQTKPVIRRLGSSSGSRTNPDQSLKEIEPALTAFLKAADDVFRKSPLPQEAPTAQVGQLAEDNQT